MRTLLQSIFGTYTPISYIDNGGLEVIPNGLAGVDFEYVFGVVLFIVVLYSVLRLVGVLLKG